MSHVAPRRPVPPLVGAGLVLRTLVVRAADALLVKALVEAYEGVASVFAERGGELTLAAPLDRERELDEIVAAVDELIACRHRQ